MGAELLKPTGRRTGGALLLALASYAGAAQGPGAIPVGQVRRVVLGNGLTVLLVEDHSSPLVSVGTMYRVGARNEAAGITGLAHYNEHMNFRATRNFAAGEVTGCITRIGGRWNGYTWIDETYYAETVPREALDRMLDLEADRMLNAVYDPEDFRKERTSVIAELHSYDDPQSVLYDAVLAASFEIHPYRNNTIGWLSDVEAVSRDDAYRFYRRFYHPNNAVLVVVGDMDPEMTLRRIRDRFDPLPGSGESTAVRTVEPAQTGQRRVTVRGPGPHAQLILAYRAPALTDPEFPAMVLFDALLAGGKGFRLLHDYASPPGTPLEQATTARSLATRVRTAWQASMYPYVYTISASAPGEPDLPRLEAAIIEALKEAEGREWGQAEIAAAVRQVRTGWALDLDDKPGRAHQLAFFEVSGGYHYLLDMPDRVAHVTREDLRRFARGRLEPHQATVGWFVPTSESPAPAPSAASRTATEPASGQPGDEPLKLPIPAQTVAPLSFALGNGLRITLAPAAGAALVAVRGRIAAGSLYDGRSPGVSALATELLSTPLPDEQATGPALTWMLHEDPGDPVSRRWIEFGAVVLPDDLRPLLETLARRLARAASGVLPASATWARAQAAVQQRSREHDASAATALLRRGLAELYPPGSSSPPWGEAEALGRTSPAELSHFLRRHVVPSRLALALAGALDPLGARSTVDDTLGRLGAGDVFGVATKARLPPPNGPASWRELRLPLAGKAQNELMVVWPGDRSRVWDATATEALLYLLGETGYAGRLGAALVEPGLVYWVAATLEEEGAPGFLMIRTAAAPRDTTEVLRRIRTIVEGAAQGTFTRRELDEAKEYLRGKTARSREGTVVTAATILRELLHPPRPAAAALTLDQLNDTARRLLRKGAPLALVAGPG